MVEIDHGNEYKTRYGHNDEILVLVGDKVKKGDTIALVGSTGRSTGPHLHYEVRKNNRTLNPIHYFFNDLTPEEYEEVITLSHRPSQSLD